ncbi:MAG: hypothetical protein KIS63_21800 [Caldilineales bacterium]|nr:hypothetical protein [Caldilineales bacterium]
MLAVLELLKRRLVRVEQPTPFGDILIEALAASEDPKGLGDL